MCHRLDSVHVRNENLSLRVHSCSRHTPVRYACWHATRVLLLVNRLYPAACESPSKRERRWTRRFAASVERARVHRRENSGKSFSFPRSFHLVTWLRVTAIVRQLQGRARVASRRESAFPDNVWISSKCIQCRGTREQC